MSNILQNVANTVSGWFNPQPTKSPMELAMESANQQHPIQQYSLPSTANVPDFVGPYNNYLTAQRTENSFNKNIASTQALSSSLNPYLAAGAFSPTGQDIAAQTKINNPNGIVAGPANNSAQIAAQQQQARIQQQQWQLGQNAIAESAIQQWQNMWNQQHQMTPVSQAPITPSVYQPQNQPNQPMQWLANYV